MFASPTTKEFQQNHPSHVPPCRSSPIELPIATKRLWKCSNKAEIQREIFQKCFKHPAWHERKFPQFLSLRVMNSETYYKYLAWQSTSLELKEKYSRVSWCGALFYFFPFSSFWKGSSKNNTVFLREGNSYEAELPGIREQYSRCQWLLNTGCTEPCTVFHRTSDPISRGFICPSFKHTPGSWNTASVQLALKGNTSGRGNQGVTGGESIWELFSANSPLKVDHFQNYTILH